MKFILVIFFISHGHWTEVKRMPNDFTKQDCVLYGNMLKAIDNDPNYIFRCIRK